MESASPRLSSSIGVCALGGVLAIRMSDPDTRRTYRGPEEGARLARGEWVIVDEVGMLDQDTAIA